MQFPYASPMLDDVYAKHGGMTGEEAREKIEFAMGLTKFTEAEIRSRREEALAIVQLEGVPQILEQCRSGDPAVMERAAAKIQFVSERHPQIACNVVQCGGLRALVAMMEAPVAAGDDDDAFSMQEVAVRAVHSLCVGDASNQRPTAEAGAIPPLLKILSEPDHPVSVMEAAAVALARLAKETAGGPAQEIITEEGGIAILVSCYKHARCPEGVREAIRHTLRFLSQYRPAMQQMSALGVQSRGEMPPA